MLSVKALLLLSGILQAIQSGDRAHLALCVFLALAFSFGAHLPKAKALSAVVIALFCFLPLLLPEALTFVPLLVFDAVYLRVFPALLPAVLSLAFVRPAGSALPLLLGAAVLAAMQAYALYSIASLRRELTETQDDATDKELSLKKEQQALSGKQDAEVYAATLAERNRIAREIHDNVGHLLSRAILLSGALKTVSSTDERLAEPLAQLDQSLNEAMDSIRESVHRLYNDSLDLEATAQSLIRDFTFCPVTLEYRCSAATPMEVRYCFLTVLKEALTNIAKHSNATKASVSMTEHPALFQMIVQDDGTQAAAESEKGEDVPRGIGLVGMSERAGALGGTVRFSSENGFRIFLTIPKKEEEGEV